MKKYINLLLTESILMIDGQPGMIDGYQVNINNDHAWKRIIERLPRGPNPEKAIRSSLVMTSLIKIHKEFGSKDQEYVIIDYNNVFGNKDYALILILTISDEKKLIYISSIIYDIYKNPHPNDILIIRKIKKELNNKEEKNITVSKNNSTITTLSEQRKKRKFIKL